MARQLVTDYTNPQLPTISYIWKIYFATLSSLLKRGVLTRRGCTIEYLSLFEWKFKMIWNANIWQIIK